MSSCMVSKNPVQEERSFIKVRQFLEMFFDRIVH